MRFNLFDKAAITLTRYVQGPLEQHFYSDSFLFGLATKREEQFEKLATATTRLIVITTLLAVFDNIVGSKVALLSTELTITGKFAPFLCFAAVASFLAWTIRFINNILVDQYLTILGKLKGMKHIELYVAPHSVSMFWSDVLSWSFSDSDEGFKQPKSILSIRWVSGLIVCLVAFYPTIICTIQIFSILKTWDFFTASYAVSVLSLGCEPNSNS